LDLKLPGGGQADKQQLRKEDIRTVDISAQGVYVLNHQQLKIDQVLAQLTQDFKYNPNLLVYIRADENTRTKDLAALLDGCNRNGITRYSLRTQPQGGR
jgi:biopolymer transport protein ExbD